MATERVAILHQGCVPIYRKPFFELLARTRAGNGREYVVFHGDPDPASGVTPAPPPYDFPNRRVTNVFFRVLGRTFAAQSALFPIVFGHYDALVVGHEIKYVTSLLLILYFRLRRRPIILWGHGNARDLEGTRSWTQQRLSQMVDGIKTRMIRWATGYMAYSASGTAYLAELGMPRDAITVLLNTIDMSDEIAAHAQWQQRERAEVRRHLGLAPDSIVLTFLGRLLPLKRAELLPTLARKLRAAGLPVEVMIVGGGADAEKLTAEFGREKWFHMPGAVFERDRLAEIMRASDALVIPDYVGLAINHGFAHGLPTITMRSPIHGPEIEYLHSGTNGLILEGEEGLLAGLGEFAGSPELRARLAAGALASRAQLTLDHMVEAFDGAVSRAFARRRG
jgi:glycosyltransferase involved in cell wall biosynthesis